MFLLDDLSTRSKLICSARCRAAQFLLPGYAVLFSVDFVNNAAQLLALRISKRDPKKFWVIFTFSQSICIVTTQASKNTRKS